MISIGIIAGCLTSIAALPQMVKTIRTQRSKDLSLWQPVLLTVGVALWMVHGFIIKDVALLVMNILPLITNLLLAGLTLRQNMQENTEGNTDA